MCFLNGLLLGDEKDLCSWAKTKWDFSFYQPEDFYIELSQDYYSKHLKNTQASQSNFSLKLKVYERFFFSSTTMQLFLKTDLFTRKRQPEK